jgi:hypothetical protein
VTQHPAPSCAEHQQVGGQVRGLHQRGTRPAADHPRLHADVARQPAEPFVEGPRQSLLRLFAQQLQVRGRRCAAGRDLSARRDPGEHGNERGIEQACLSQREAQSLEAAGGAVDSDDRASKDFRTHALSETLGTSNERFAHAFSTHRGALSTPR